MAKQTTPRLVKEVPAGYKEEIRNGKKVYVKVKETPIPKTPTQVNSKPTKTKPSGTPRKFPPPTPKPVLPDFKAEEDVVYLEEPTPKETVLKSSVQTYGNKLPRRDANQTFDTFEFADQTGNTTNKALRANFEGNKEVTFDDKGNKIYTGKTLEDFRNQSIQQIETPMMSGVNKPNPNKIQEFSEQGITFDKNASGGIGVNKSTLGVDLKGATDTYVPKRYDLLGKEIITPNTGLQPLGTGAVNTKEVGRMYDAEKPVEIKGKFAKGGVVSKIKGYTNGGTTGYEITGLDAGVVGQNDPYSAQRTKEKQDEIDAAKKKANQDKARGVANNIGEGMGGLGSAYYNSQPTQNEGEATRNAGLATASQMGGIGGMIGGIAALGDKLGKPTRNRSEKVNSSGELLDENKAKRNAAIGITFSPSKRLSYEGGLTDITGQKYLDSIEGKTKAQLAQVKEANAKSAQQQAIAARNNQEENPTITNPYDLSGVTFDENQNMVLAGGQQFDANRQFAKGGVVGKVKQMCADGGVIEGKGGPKDDKISAKVKPGSFVVPAENTKVAEVLREKLLMKAPKKKANLNQKGGSEVMLSDKEHLFTPEEKHELMEKGVNVNALAPNAEHKEEMMEKKSHIMFPKFAEGGTIPKGTKVNGATWDGKNWISANGDKYTSEKGKAFENAYNTFLAKEKSNQEQKTGAEINLYKRKLEEAKKGDNQSEIDRLQAKINSLTGVKKEIETPSTEAKTTTKPSVKAPKVTTPKVTVENLPTKDLSLQGLKQDAELKTANQAAMQEASIANAPTRQAVINDANVVDNENYLASKPKSKNAWANKLSNIDPTAFVGIGQSALGLNMLGKEKRPIDNAVIDPTYNAAVNRAQQDALFGLTPEQRFMAEQDIQGGLNDAKFAGLNSSASDSFNRNRAAINDAWKNKLGLKQADAEMRMNKQKYADAMAADRASILAGNRRQAFKDSMDAFQQKQAAGSELIGAGLANTIGAYRFKKDQEARLKADEARGYSLNNYNPTT